MRHSVTVHIKATPETIWPFVSDVVANTRQFAAETFDAEWLDGATAPAVGVRFRGHVKRNGRGPVYWSAATIDVCEPARDFSFVVGLAGRPANRWRYQLQANGDGTDVTESFELQNAWYVRLYWALLGWARRRANLRNMRTTLERMKVAAERAPTV
jgi:Polyketide cyclase / dehydrase and lipid transport